MKNRLESTEVQPSWLTDTTALYNLSCELDAIRFESPHECLRTTEHLLSLPGVSSHAEVRALLSVHVADSYRQLSRYREAAETCMEAVKALELFKSSFSFPRALNSLGSVEGSLGNLGDALKHSLLALQLAEAGGYSGIAAKCCLTLSFLYCLLHQYDCALEYCDRVDRQHCDLSMLTVLCINGSEALDHLGRYEEALEVIDRGFGLVERLPDRKFHTLLLSNKACLFASIGRDEEALELAELCEKCFLEDGYDRYLPLPSRDLGARYLRLKDFERGTRYVEKAISLAQEPDRRHLLLELNEMLADCYMGRGQTEEAFRILKANLASVNKKFANQIIETGESRANEQLEWIRREYDLLQEVNIEIRRAKESVEESNRRKTELLANISHEIRTPMNGVIGLAKKLSSTHLTADQLLTVRNITKCGENLLNIVDEIISLTEIENGNLQVQRYEFDLREFIAEIEMLFEPLCEEKKLTFVCQLDSDISPAVVGDASRIRQVVINFIGNALKFTVSGSIALRIQRVPEQTEPQRVRLSVTDTGSGISTESQTAILQGESSRYSLNSRKFGGNGLGLTISRNIVSALGGQFGLDSELNAGSTFWFEVDLPTVSRSLNDPVKLVLSEEALVAERPLKGLRILVAEDNIINWMVIESLLAQLGASVSRASDGEEAVQLESLALFDVILMDCHMPKMSGYQASALIRERELLTGERKLILALSADVMDANKELCQQCGMDGFLNKPISTAGLVATIKRHLAGELP